MPLRSFVAVVLAAAPLIAACGGGHLAGGPPPPDEEVSPGTVTLRLTLPPERSFCETAGGYAIGADPHVSFGTGLGQWFNVGGSSCGVQCGTCLAVPCAAIPICTAGMSEGRALTQIEATWDGAYVETSACALSSDLQVGCVRPRFVRPGRYVARVCATPGTVTTVDVAAPTCTATGPKECADVPFDLPGPALVEATLSPTPIDL